MGGVERHLPDGFSGFGIEGQEVGECPSDIDGNAQVFKTVPFLLSRDVT
jgi:hypothetical protein